MKVIYFLAVFLLFSCSSKKNEIIAESKTVKKNLSDSNYNISAEEKNIVNDFLANRINDKIYNRYRDYELVIMEESVSGNVPVSIYESCYNDRNSRIKSAANENWVLDSTGIKMIKFDLKNEIKYSWKRSDFFIDKISFFKTDELRKSIQSGSYVNLKKRLLIYLSRPVIIDDNTAFMYINSGNSMYGFESIEKVTVLMKKNNNKWYLESTYYDSNSIW